MKKENKMNVRFKDKKELMDMIIGAFKFELATQNEKDRWPYQSELKISIKNIIGNKIFYKKEYAGIALDCFFGRSGRNHPSVRTITEKGEYSLTDLEIEIYDPIHNKNIVRGLHPARAGLNFWSEGNILEEKDYKSLYYSTQEYRDKFETSLNKNYGTSGCTSPMQIKEIQQQISDTIQERHGTPWFLNRGNHYSAITETMVNRYGIDNLFKSSDWQYESQKSRKHTSLGSIVSSFEKGVISELINKFEFIKCHHCLSREGQYLLKVEDEKLYYHLDFYDEELNMVIEICGDYWHCNPNKYKEDYFHKKVYKTAQEIWNRDFVRKNNIINQLNCTFVEIWESDWRKNKENIILFIDSKIKEIKNEIIKNKVN